MSIKTILVSILTLSLVSGFTQAEESSPVSNLVRSLGSTMKYSYESISHQKELGSILNASASYLDTLNSLLLSLESNRQDGAWERQFLCESRERNDDLMSFLSNLSMPISKEEDIAYLQLIASMMGDGNSTLDYMIKSWKYSCLDEGTAELFRNKLNEIK